jgi:hypothetical protein
MFVVNVDIVFGKADDAYLKDRGDASDLGDDIELRSLGHPAVPPATAEDREWSAVKRYRYNLPQSRHDKTL